MEHERSAERLFLCRSEHAWVSLISSHNLEFTRHEKYRLFLITLLIKNFLKNLYLHVVVFDIFLLLFRASENLNWKKNQNYFKNFNDTKMLPLADNFFVLIIFAANSSPVDFWTHLRTTEKAPLQFENKRAFNKCSRKKTEILYWSSC